MRRRTLDNKEAEDVEVAKKWERIAEVTIEEQRGNISIVEDLNGNPFELSDVEVFIISLPGEAETGMGITVSPSKDRSYPAEIGLCAASNEIKRYLYAKFEKSGFGLLNTQMRSSQNGTNIYASMALVYNMFLLASDEGMEGPDTCTGIWVGSHYQSVLSPGTKIIVNGVRV